TLSLSSKINGKSYTSNASEKFSNTPTDGEDICISPACVLSTISLSPPTCPSGYISTVILPSDLSSTSSWNFSYISCSVASVETTGAAVISIDSPLSPPLVYASSFPLPL